MNVKILTLVIVLLVSLLCSAGAGPMASTEHGRGLEEAATVRKMAQQNPVRGGQTHRPAKRRRHGPVFPTRAHAVLEQGTALSALPRF